MVPFKTCSYDCTYCQLGCTTNKTAERAEYVPVDRILRDLRNALETGPAPDYITLAGSGEPTLHSGLGRVIAEAKSLTRVPVAVLTNGSLLWRQDVVEDCLGADLVVPSLDAGDANAFQKVNRPHPDISFQRMVQGLVDFRRAFEGEMWLEVFLLAGITAQPIHVAKIASIISQIGPDRAQLNTVARPPAEPDARAVSLDDLDALAELIPGFVEVIADHPLPASNTGGRGSADLVLDLLRRRPCTLQDIAAGLDMHPNEVLKYTDRLVREGLVEHQEVAGRSYYSAPSAGDSA